GTDEDSYPRASRLSLRVWLMHGQAKNEDLEVDDVEPPVIAPFVSSRFCCSGSVMLNCRIASLIVGVFRLDMADHGGRCVLDAHDRPGGMLRLLGHVTAPLADRGR